MLGNFIFKLFVEKEIMEREHIKKYNVDVDGL